MINFSTLQSLTIPEGKVKQITDANGIVLWNAVKNAKITITSQWDGFDGDSASITVKSSTPFAPDPTNPNNKVTSWTVFVYDQPNRTIEVPVGSTIECTISRDKGNAESYISLNGTNMVTGEGTYIYTVTGDATVAIKELYVQGDYGVITIVEASVVVLEVEKQTLTTYAGETSYADESFVLLDIYPENANSTVNVTYGGLTKTLEFSGTNAQQVYFGTFNGVSDSITTPASGKLIIEGGYRGFGVGGYKANSYSKDNSSRCGCITNVISWGRVKYMPSNIFHNCSKLTHISFPDGITNIPSYAFYGCTNLALTSLPSGITSIGEYAFYGCTNLALTSLPSGITSIPDAAFYNCINLALTELPSGVTSIGNAAFRGCGFTSITIPDSVTEIGNSAFLYCRNLNNVIIGDGVEILPFDAFGYIGENVPKEHDIYVRVGKAVTEIGHDALLVSRLGSPNDILEMTATTPPKIMVSDANTASFGPYWDTIIVPKGYIDVYRAADEWCLIESKYSTDIVEASE